MSDSKEKHDMDVDDDEEKEETKGHKEKKHRKKRKASPEKIKEKSAKKSKKKQNESDGKDDKEEKEDQTESDTWKQMDKEQKSSASSSASASSATTTAATTANASSGQEKSPVKPESTEEKSLVPTGQSHRAIVSVPRKNLNSSNPNDYLRTHPNYFENIPISDIIISKWRSPAGFKNAGKMNVKVEYKKSVGTNLLVVGPWTALTKAYYTKDGNYNDPKAVQWFTDKDRPWLEARYVLTYISKMWDAANDNGFGNDKDVCKYLLWWALLSMKVFQFIVDNDDVLDGLKLLSENPTKQQIYNRLLKHFRGPILRLPTDRPADSKSETQPPLPIVDPASITTCEEGVWIHTIKAPCYKKYEAGPGREKPIAGPMILQDDRMRQAYENNRIYNPCVVYPGKSMDAIPYNKQKLVAKDICSSMTEVKVFTQGVDSKTGLALFGFQNVIRYTRILKSCGAMNLEGLANQYDDTMDLAGEEFIDFDSRVDSSSSTSSSSSASEFAKPLDKNQVNKLLGFNASTTTTEGGGSKGYHRV